VTDIHVCTADNEWYIESSVVIGGLWDGFCLIAGCNVVRQLKYVIQAHLKTFSLPH
jgi:hypothetical protein